MDQSLQEAIELFRKTHRIESTFNQKFTLQIQEMFLKNGLTNLVKQGNWPTLFVPHSESDITKIFPYIKQASCWELRLNYKYFPNIIHRIYDPDFSKLQILNLEGNHIVNIQGLTFLKMENIEELYLEQNRITNFQPLQKTRWNQFQKICIGNNLGSQITLDRIKVNPIFSVLSLEYNFEKRTFFNDITRLMKFQASMMDAFKLSDETRITQLKANEVLRKKYLQGLVLFD